MANSIRRELVRQGRNPDWQRGWEQDLSPEARTEIRTALRERRRVRDPDLLDYAQGLARRRLRTFRWSLAFAPLHIGLVAAWIYATCVVANWAMGWCLFWVALGIVWLLVVPFIASRRLATLVGALQANSDSAA